ncbi:905_t:CDS:2 [Diversispora eburnea]|uniref:905_t:CDS:1 n=1 Tax=Diversispora eburnea TaxID=1213867 RepID=A0A9N8VZQ0_9GLOM|nr:905_t:CDS:2 [Diversispora eburnea]
MVDNSELRFVAKIIRNKSRQRSCSILVGQNNIFNPLKIHIIEPSHKIIEFGSIDSPLSSTSTYSSCSGGTGIEWNRRKSVAQLIFYWETVFLVGAKAARKYAGWGPSVVSLVTNLAKHYR